MVACTASEAIDVSSGAAGTSSPGTAGNGPGVAGSSGAAGGGGSGAAGTTTSGAAGGGGGGKGGSTGSAGSAGSVGSAGTTGKAGSTGSAGAGSGAAGTTGAGGNKADGAAGTGATGATDAGADAAKLVYAGYIDKLLALNCGGCHLPLSGNGMGNFAFSYTNLLSNVNSEHAGCPNLDASKKRVVPGKPENSLLYIKASLATPPSGCGGHMPFAGQMLGDTTLKLIYDWIKQGANP
jgi:hypothetical protein